MLNCFKKICQLCIYFKGNFNLLLPLFFTGIWFPLLAVTFIHCVEVGKGKPTHKIESCVISFGWSTKRNVGFLKIYNRGGIVREFHQLETSEQGDTVLCLTHIRHPHTAYVDEFLVKHTLRQQYVWNNSVMHSSKKVEKKGEKEKNEGYKRALDSSPYYCCLVRVARQQSCSHR